MNTLTSVGLILLCALLAGELVRAIRAPAVTGYILAGVAIGPAALGWIGVDTLSTLEVLAEVALGLILFTVGAAFEVERFRRTGGPLLALAVAESVLAAVAVAVVAIALGQPWPVAALLGALAMETAPASTLLIVRECRSAGPLTDTLLGVVALDNLLCIATYLVVASAIDLAVSTGVPGVALAAHQLLWQLCGSAALGYLVGLLLVAGGALATTRGEQAMLLVGSILLCVGVAGGLALSPLIASLVVGATTSNLSPRVRERCNALSASTLPVYAVFFVVAGAGLDLALVPSMGVLGLAYVGCRLAGKGIGATLMAGRLRLAPPVQRYLPYALVVQAGLAVGLTLAIDRRFPEHAAVVSTVVLAAVAVFELVGPFASRYALVRAGESGLRPEPGPGPLVASPVSPWS